MRDPLQTGRVTIPGEAGRETEVARLAALWGADAVRDSDGTSLSPELLALGCRVYSTVCLIRSDQSWAQTHRRHLQQKYLLSDPHTATSKRLSIRMMDGYFDQQFEPNYDDDPAAWWEVMDRTTGTTVSPKHWSVDPATGVVSIAPAVPWHVYTVTFLARQIWDVVSMYNHMVNGWTTPHAMPLDPRHEETRRHLLAWLESWLKDHPQTEIVRLTSLIYNFTFNFDAQFLRKYADWCGYSDTVSPEAIRQFEAEYGYRPSPESFVANGLYHHYTCVPTPFYRQWQEFIQRFVCQFGRDCVQRIHAAGKRAYLFFCDHWIGTEPYGHPFASMQFDGVVSPVSNGIEASRIADVPGPIEKELRLYPYFFPVDLAGNGVFKPGGDPTAESRANWLSIRRAILRRPVDRIGYGGYLSLTRDFPEFQSHVADLCREFRFLAERSGRTRPYSAPFRVAFLNAWGRLRSWINGEHEGGGLVMSMTGLPFEVDFVSFDDVREDRIPSGVRVLINTGNQGTSWSGGHHWMDPNVCAAIRQWVHERGGGLLVVGHGAAGAELHPFFRIADVLGVQREVGLTGSHGKPAGTPSPDHFILADPAAEWMADNAERGVYASDPATEILVSSTRGVELAAHRFGRGRAVYYAGYKMMPAMMRILLRTLYWVAGEQTEPIGVCENPQMECACYPATGWAVVINNDHRPQTTRVRTGNGKSFVVALDPFGYAWGRIANGEWIPTSGKLSE